MTALIINFPLLPRNAWEKVPEERMRAVSEASGRAACDTGALRAPALIRRFAPPSPNLRSGEGEKFGTSVC
jgi:hypothetical protein